MPARPRYRQEAAIKLRQAGKSYRLIGAWLGVHNTTVMKWAKDAEENFPTAEKSAVGNVESADGKFRPAVAPSAETLTEREETALKLREEGRTLKEIAEAIGVSSPQTASNTLARAEAKRSVEPDEPDEFEELTQPPAIDMRVFELIEYAARSMSVEDTHNIRTLRVDPKLEYVEYISAKRMKKTADSTVGGRDVRFVL